MDVFRIVAPAAFDDALPGLPFLVDLVQHHFIVQKGVGLFAICTAQHVFGFANHPDILIFHRHGNLCNLMTVRRVGHPLHIAAAVEFGHVKVFLPLFEQNGLVFGAKAGTIFAYAG